MSTPVPQAASAFALATVRTGQPVRVGGLERMSAEGAHVVGHNLHKTGEAQIPLRPAGRTVLEGLAHRVQVPYVRSEGAQVARLAVELHPSDELGGYQTVAVSLPSGASMIDDGDLDGSTLLYNPAGGRTTPRELVAWIDVSGVTAGTLTDAVELTVTPSAKGAGVRRATVTESPLAAFAVGASEPVVDGAAVRTGRLVAESWTQDVFTVMVAGRAGYRQHWCVSGLESDDVTGAATTPHWSREASTLGAIDWLGATDPAFYFAPRALYGSATSGAWKARVRYRTSNGTACELRIYVEAGDISGAAWVGAGSGVVTHTITLPGTSNAWAWLDQAVTIPVDGPLVRVSIEAKGPGVGQLLSLGCIALIEAEL